MVIKFKRFANIIRLLFKKMLPSYILEIVGNPWHTNLEMHEQMLSVGQRKPKEGFSSLLV